MPSPSAQNSQTSSPLSSFLSEGAAGILQQAQSVANFFVEGVKALNEDPAKADATLPKELKSAESANQAPEPTKDTYTRVYEQLKEIAPEPTQRLMGILSSAVRVLEPSELNKDGTPRKKFRERSENDPWYIKHAADILTGINVASAPVAVTLALSGHPVEAGYTFVAGAVADRLDGTVARLLDWSTKEGAIWDDIGDAINFGLAAPAVAASVLYSAGGNPWAIGTAFTAYTLSAGWRLKKFVSAPQRKGFFTGIPTTAAASYIAASLVFGQGGLPYDAPAWAGALGLAGLGVLMNSPAVYRKFAQESKPHLSSVAVFSALFGVGWAKVGFVETAFLSLSAYLLLGPVESLYRVATGKRFPKLYPQPKEYTEAQHQEIIEVRDELVRALVGAMSRGVWISLGAEGKENVIPVTRSENVVVRGVEDFVRTTPSSKPEIKRPETKVPGTHSRPTATDSQVPYRELRDERPDLRTARPGEQRVERPGAPTEFRTGIHAIHRPGNRNPLERPKAYGIGRTDYGRGKAGGRSVSGPHR